jgi:hypothetical protein
MDELYVDLSKGFAGGGVPGRLNTAKLVRRMVQVRGKNGKIFNRMQWVKPWEASTGHGVRAIHNQSDYKEAKDDGVFEHPDAHNALAHQGIHNAEHMLNGIHHEHPVYVPETQHSGSFAEVMGNTNHIPHGATEYDRHGHTNKLHYDPSEPKDLHDDDEESYGFSNINEAVDWFEGLSDSDREAVENLTDGSDLNDLSVDDWNKVHRQWQEDDSDDGGYTGHEQSIRDMVNLREPSQAKPKSKAISEQAEPLDINQIAKEYSGPSLEDMHTGMYGDVSDERKKTLHDLFGGMSVPALEHIFSHPNGDYSVRINDVDFSGSKKVKLDASIHDEAGNHIGFMNRSVYRKEDGTYHVHNDLLNIREGKDNGVATHLYHRSEQLWKHLAGEGKRVEISVFANISIGTYAWASKHKGFDFDSTYERNTKRKELREFIEMNDWDEDEVMEACGYTSVDDLNHAWQFAELDDGYTYDLTPHGFEAAKGSAHLGKAFMLTHANSWNGMKYINEDGSVDRQKHVDRLVSQYKDDMGDWDFDDYDEDEFDDDEDEHNYQAHDEEGAESPANWFYSMPSVHQNRIMGENGLSAKDLEDYTSEDWDNLYHQVYGRHR